MKNKIWIFALLLFSGGFIYPASSQVSQEGIYSRYLNCDLQYFLDNDIDDPLFKALKAVVFGDYTQAEKLLLAVIPTVSNSLKKYIYTDLAYVNYTRKLWSKGNEYAFLAEPDLKPKANPYHYFPKYPTEYIQTKRDTVSIDLVHTYIPYVNGSVNDSDKDESLILDTGASRTAVSVSLAEKYHLQIDSLDVSMLASGFAIPTNAHSTIINKLILGEIEFFNIPIIVIGDEMFKRLGLKGEIILGLPEMMLFDVVKFNYPRKKVTMIRGTKRQNVKPNFATLDFHPIINYKVRGETVSGLVDTGSPFTYLISSQRWDPQKERVVRSVERVLGNYKYTSNYYEFPLFFPDGFDGNYQIQILPKPPLPHRFQKHSVLGNDIWLDKILVIDFKNRLVRFEKEE